MTDPSGRDGWGQEHPGTYNYPAIPGSPYGQQAPHQPDAGLKPTEQLPAYSPYGYDPYATGQYAPPNPPGDRRLSHPSLAAPGSGCGYGYWRRQRC